MLQHAESVCKQLEWTGLASFDFVLGEDGEFRFVDFNPRHWGSADATLPNRGRPVQRAGPVDPRGHRGPASRPLPGISTRVFPKYTFEPSGMSPWRRLAGLRDAPWNAPSFVAGEVAREIVERITRLQKSVTRASGHAR